MLILVCLSAVADAVEPVLFLDDWDSDRPPLRLDVDLRGMPNPNELRSDLTLLREAGGGGGGGCACGCAAPPGGRLSDLDSVRPRRPSSWPPSKDWRSGGPNVADAVLARFWDTERERDTERSRALLASSAARFASGVAPVLVGDRSLFVLGGVFFFLSCGGDGVFFFQVSIVPAREQKRKIYKWNI
jgi:hypothetical protein